MQEKQSGNFRVLIGFVCCAFMTVLLVGTTLFMLSHWEKVTEEAFDACDAADTVAAAQHHFDGMVSAWLRYRQVGDEAFFEEFQKHAQEAEQGLSAIQDKFYDMEAIHHADEIKHQLRLFCDVAEKEREILSKVKSNLPECIVLRNRLFETNREMMKVAEDEWKSRSQNVNDEEYLPAHSVEQSRLFGDWDMEIQRLFNVSWKEVLQDGSRDRQEHVMQEQTERFRQFHESLTRAKELFTTAKKRAILEELIHLTDEFFKRNEEQWTLIRMVTEIAQERSVLEQVCLTRFEELHEITLKESEGRIVDATRIGHVVRLQLMVSGMIVTIFCLVFGFVFSRRATWLPHHDTAATPISEAPRDLGPIADKLQEAVELLRQLDH